MEIGLFYHNKIIFNIIFPVNLSNYTKWNLKKKKQCNLHKEFIYKKYSYISSCHKKDNAYLFFNTVWMNLNVSIFKFCSTTYTCSYNEKIIKNINNEKEIAEKVKI